MVRVLNCIQTILTIISTQPVSEIIAYLVNHGCQDITSMLDLPSATTFPISNGGFGDIYQVRLRDATQVAIKTMRLEIDSTSSGQKHLKACAAFFGVVLAYRL
jgi:hypothetical protein